MFYITPLLRNAFQKLLPPLSKNRSPSIHHTKTRFLSFSLAILSTTFITPISAHIEFEDISVPGGTVNDKSQSTKGFSFFSTASTNDSILVKKFPEICESGCIDNGTQFLYAYNSDQTGPFEILMTREDGKLFDLDSFEFATLLNIIPLEESELEIVGTKSNDEIVVQSFFYDDNSETFQLVTVDESFTDLKSVLFRSISIYPALDNLKAYLVENIDFEDAYVPDSSISGAFQSSAGFTFVNTASTKDALLVIRSPTACEGSCIDNGTQYLAAFNPDQTGPFEVMMVHDVGILFNLRSFEFASLFGSTPPAGTELEIVGTLIDGETVEQSFIYDNNGETFQLVNVESDFFNLRSVLFRSPIMFPTFDNFEVLFGEFPTKANKIIANNGSDSTAKFSYGASSDFGISFSLEFKESDFILVQATFSPDVNDLGKDGVLYAAVKSKNENGLSFSFLNSDLVFEEWDLTVPGLGAARSVSPLLKNHSLRLFAGNLTAGTYKYYLAYSTEDSELIYTGRALTIKITE